MNSTINLDPIVRKLDDHLTSIADEEVVVTIDLSSKKAVEKGFLVRFGGNFQDYLIANNRNPTRTASGRFSNYYIRDAHNERTLAIEISITASCPAGGEVKVAEALHGELPPAGMLAALLERWIREFIPLGDEGRFIDTYDVARHQLEKHLAARAYAQTGLEVLPKVALSGEPTVAGEIVVGPIELGVRLHLYTEEQKITVESGLALDSQNYVKAFVFHENQVSPEELFKRSLKEYFFQHVSFQQFTRELQYPSFKQPLLEYLGAALKQVGRRVRFVNISTAQKDNVKPPREFVAVNYHHEHYIHGRSQPVIIQNTVQLYCEDSVAFLASRITDLEAWVKEILNIVLKRHLIGKSYVDLILRFAPLEESIKREMSARALLIGYRVDHLVSIPNLREEEELKNPFLLETEDTFETSLDNFEVQLKFHIKLCIPRLDSIEKYLNPGTDVKEAIKEVVLREARHWLRNIHPERFYLYFNKPNKAASTAAVEDERLPVNELLNKKIQEGLKKEFNARIFDLTLRVGRSDLTERYHNLCFVIRGFRVSIESPDPQATEDLTLTGNFELRGVYPDEDGWRRFSVLQLDLDGLQHLLETHLRAELKTYYQPGFMFQNRSGRDQVFNLVENRATFYMRQEFGLMIHLTNLDRNITKAEKEQQKLLINLEQDKLNAMVEQSKLLVAKLKVLRSNRINLLPVAIVDKRILQETEEEIEHLEKELEAISSARFGQHRLAATLESQSPDELPRLTEEAQPATQSELESEPKAQLSASVAS